jgi:hypothetical protein
LICFLVILSVAKDLVSTREILRYAQDHKKTHSIARIGSDGSAWAETGRSANVPAQSGGIDQFP